MNLASGAGSRWYCRWLVSYHAGASDLKILSSTSPSSSPLYSKRKLHQQRDLVTTRTRPRQQHKQLSSRGTSLRSATRSFSHSSCTLHQEGPPTTTPPRSSVSDTEVSHFSALASSWWDPHGSSRLLHLMNPLRHDFIQRSLSMSSSSSSSSTTPSQLTYLDIGCGGGIFSCSAALLPSTKSVTGIDPTGACIDAARGHARTDPALRPPSQGGKLRFLHTSIEDLPSSSSQDLNNGGSSSSSSIFPPLVDIITVFEVVEHVTSPTSFLRSAAAHLKPGGWLIGSTISRHPLSYLTTKLLGEAPLIGFVPRGTHDWNKYINPDELRQFFQTDVDDNNDDQGGGGRWENFHVQGVVYVPGLGWREVTGSERVGNYFFGVQKKRSSSS